MEDKHHSANGSAENHLGPALTGTQLRDALAEGCRNTMPAVVAPSDLTAAHLARLASLSDDGALITLEMLEPDETLLARYFACCVSFVYSERSWFFSSQVRDYKKATAAELPALVLKTPSHAIGSDLRRAVRISVPPQSGLSVRAVSEAGGVSPQAIDISLNGISLECVEGHDPEWPSGSRVQVQMSFEGSTVMLEAEVRHRHGHVYGLAFPEAVGGERSELPETYRSILRSLEKAWLVWMRERQ